MRFPVGYTLAVVLGAMGLFSPLGLSHAHAAGPQRMVPIMTQNMDEGTGFGPLLTATSLPEFEAAVTATYQEVQASKPDERARAVAHEIVVAAPTLVGLQEAALWRENLNSRETMHQKGALAGNPLAGWSIGSQHARAQICKQRPA